MTRRPIRARLAALLERDTSTGAFIPEIDGLRFVAIASVVLYHLNAFAAAKSGRAPDAGALAALLDRGGAGVQLFFVISGFVIALPFAARAFDGRPRPPLRAYFLRRLTRLEPPYLINLLVLYSLLVVVRHDDARALLPHLAASAVYLHNLVYGTGSAINFVAWSLEIELQFYLLAPLIAAVFTIRSTHRRRALLGLGILAAALASLALATWRRDFPPTILSQGQYFLTGFLLVDVYLHDWKGRPTTRPAYDLLSLAGWGGLVLLLFAPPAARLALPIAIFVAYCAAFRGTLSRRVFAHPAVYLVGGMCYTMYLYHFHIISLVGNPAIRLLGGASRPAWQSSLALAVVVLPSVLIGSAVLFVLLEKPFMRRGWHVRLAERGRARARMVGALLARRA